LSDSTTALLTVVPAIFQAIGMVLIARSSDRTGERRYHAAASAGMAAIGLLTAALIGNPIAAFAALSVTALGIWGTVGPFWAIPTSYLSRSAAAGGIALINSIGNLGGFAGPYAIGLIKEHTHSFTAALSAVSGFLLLAAILILFTAKASTPGAAKETAA
jgi:nitrate/nitrite transporter NarK